MSKYGFNENEVRKTIITKVDKDGFHKEEVFDGNVDGGSSLLSVATMTVEDNGVSYLGPAIYDDEDESEEQPSVSYLSGPVNAGESLAIPVYKGLAMVNIENLSNCVVTGDAEIDPDVEGSLRVYGDFTIVGPNV